LGKGNIEEFSNHVSKHKDVEHRSLAELADFFSNDLLGYYYGRTMVQEVAILVMMMD
jgi:hypothetical protein